MIARMISSLSVQLQKSSMVPFVGAVLDTPCTTLKTSLQTASHFISEKRKLGLYASFPCHTTQGRKKPLKRSRTKIRANAPHSQNEKHPPSLPTNGYISPFHTNICFLHACTPARPNACTPYACTPAHSDSVQGTNRRSATKYKKTYPSKNLRAAETVGDDSSGGASEPHRSKYMSLHSCFVLFIG